MCKSNLNECYHKGDICDLRDPDGAALYCQLLIIQNLIFLTQIMPITNL